ncbi:MAG: hypothetical protein SFV19_18845 [Rhodospirillaceae bacterium]|nr:hypothetical protein [Rhodospirillaceae bacterium]
MLQSSARIRIVATMGFAMAIYSLAEAQKRFSKLVDRAIEGEGVFIMGPNGGMVVLTPLVGPARKSSRRRKKKASRRPT